MTYDEIIMMIKDELMKRGISQRAFAEITGYSHGALSNWLTRRNPAPFRVVEDMLTALGYTLIMEVKENNVE